VIIIAGIQSRSRGCGSYAILLGRVKELEACTIWPLALRLDGMALKSSIAF
jgi:hypothetical protein